jgi:hypothetical protein
MPVKVGRAQTQRERAPERRRERNARVGREATLAQMSRALVK